MILVIDNYDSFTYNLVQYLGELGARMQVFRNDKITIKEAKILYPDKVLISPGPCTPKEAGISCDIIREFGPHIPLLGVCLGHQSIAEVFGGKVIRAERLMHGKTSPILHKEEGVFNGLPCPFDAMRYHSLIVERDSLPDCLKITAETAEGEIMGFMHTELPVHGVQFHPESILTPCGKHLLQNFLEMQATFSPRLPRWSQSKVAPTSCKQFFAKHSVHNRSKPIFSILILPFGRLLYEILDVFF